MTTAHLYIQTVIDNIDFIGKKISCSVGVQGYTPKGVCTLLYPKNRHFALFRGTGTKRGTVPFCTPNYCIYSQCIFAHHHHARIHLINHKYKKYMTDIYSGLFHMYPVNYNIQTFLKTHLWECSPVLPLININYIKNIISLYPP